MKALLIEKTKQEKIINEVQKKRNLFGLGLTSLIAACSADNAGNGAGKDKEEVVVEEVEPTAAALTPLPSVITSDQNNNNNNLKLTAPSGTDTRNSIKDLKIVVNEALATNITRNFEVIFKNGKHSGTDDSYSGGEGKASVYKGLVADNQYDLIVSSSHFGAADDDGFPVTGAVYIFWNINGGGTIDNVETDSTKNFLKVVGLEGTDQINSKYTEFYQLGGMKDDMKDQPDLFFSSKLGFHILWDVTKHSGRQEKDLDINSPGILHVKVNSSSGNAVHIITKINDDESYDIITQDEWSQSIYILWDVAKYYDAGAKVVVLNADTTNAIHGLLTIDNSTDQRYSLPFNDEDGYSTRKVGGEGVDKDDYSYDIDGDEIKDIAFEYGAKGKENVYILFGRHITEKGNNDSVPSYTFKPGTVQDAGNVKLYAKGSDEMIRSNADYSTEGFFHYDFDGENGIDDNEKWVGYRFNAYAEGSTNKRSDLGDLKAIKAAYDANPITANPTELSEEVYWDIA